MAKVDAGQNIQARNMGGDVVGDTGTSSAVGATTMTDSGKSWTTNAFAGHVVYTGAVYGVIQSNTGTVLTIDRWSVVSNPGAAAASSTPSTGTYQISFGGFPAVFMGLTANASAVSGSDTSLTAEITTASGGLVRKICTYAHTAGVASYSLSAIYTANGSDSLPVTIAKVGVFTSMVVAATTSTMLFETLLSTTATLSASGDQLTVTDTIAM